MKKPKFYYIYFINLIGPTVLIEYLPEQLSNYYDERAKILQSGENIQGSKFVKSQNNPLYHELRIGKKALAADITSTKEFNVIYASTIGLALFLVMSILIGVFVYQRKKQLKRQHLEDEYIAKSHDPSSVKEIYMSNGGANGHSLDKRLAQTAHIYQYQHQKQQMLSLQKQMSILKDNEEVDSEDEVDEDGDYTVYECPGLASASEMEVKNPLFNEAANVSTPSSSAKED